MKIRKKISDVQTNSSIDRLKEYLIDDEIYQKYLNGENNFNDFEKYCLNHCKDIDNVIRENARLKKRINRVLKQNNIEILKGDEKNVQM